jgi:hypothetical protein
MLGSQAEKDMMSLGDLFGFLTDTNSLHEYYLWAKSDCREIQQARIAGAAELAEAKKASKQYCPHCGRECSGTGSLDSHLYASSGKGNHPTYQESDWRDSERAEGRFPCEYCHKSYDDEWKLQSHLTSMDGTKGHPKAIAARASLPPGKVDCEIAGPSLTLRRHWNRMNGP